MAIAGTTERVNRAAVGSGALLTATLVLLSGSLALSGAPPGETAISTWLGVVAVLGTIIVRRAGSRIGWLLQAAVALASASGFARAFANEAALDGSGPLVIGAAWMSHWLTVPAAGMFIYLFLLFPDSRLPGARWRTVAWAAGAGIVLLSTAIALSPGRIEGVPTIRNPLGIDGAAPVLEVIDTLGSFLLVPSAIAAVVSLFVRLRRAEGDEREQLKWLLYAAGLLFVTGTFAMVAEGGVNELSFIALLIGLFAVPLAFAVALTKYHLYDIDLVVNRTLVYLVLTAAVVVLYILIVGAMGSLFQKRVGLMPALVATGIVAVIFEPLRRVSQNAVDRLMFGQRRDPYGALADLSLRLESTFDPTEILPAIVETVARSLKLAYVAIEVEKDGRSEIAASEGERTLEAEATPLVYQGEEVGRLVIAPRRGDVLSATDHRLLADLARGAGAAVHAVALTEALRRSRNELLAAREEERRRLRRDLHDGLGPELAGIALGVGAAVNLTADGDVRTRELLVKIQAQADSATRSIRAIVDGLRPSALDELGLVGAVREKGKAIAIGSGMDFDVVLTSEVPELSAAVEVAGMRIAMEAVNNAVRHSQGSSCVVTIAAGDQLMIEIADDGVGIASHVRRGVGLLSMRERAEEVGGSVIYGAGTNGGTVVRVDLPLP